VYGITNATDGVGVRGDTTGGYGVHGVSTGGIGVRGESTNQHGGLFTNNSSIGFAALQGIASGTPGYGIYGEGNSIGVWGSTTNGTGVRGATTGGYGVHGYSLGANNGGIGVRGESSGGDGVFGLSAATDGFGVHGISNDSSLFGRAIGVYGESSEGYGVKGSGGDIGVTGVAYGAAGSIGVYALNFGGGRALFADSDTGLAGDFGGDISVGGQCFGCFGPNRIDHPLDPENKYLSQVAVQSDDMLDVYSGNVTTDGKGEAVVTLPDWFEALNKDFRYQLTPIGQFAQAIVASEIKDNRFTIKTDKPNVKVSWLVTSVRNDPYAQAHPVQPEVEKPADEKGQYLHPELYGQPESKGIGYEDRQRLRKASATPQEQPKP